MVAPRAGIEAVAWDSPHLVVEGMAAEVVGDQDIPIGRHQLQDLSRT